MQSSKGNKLVNENLGVLMLERFRYRLRTRCTEVPRIGRKKKDVAYYEKV